MWPLTCALLMGIQHISSCAEGYAKVFWWTCMSNPCSGGYEACVKIPEACGDKPRCDCGLEEACARRGFACQPRSLGNGQFCCREGEGHCSMAP